MFSQAGKIDDWGKIYFNTVFAFKKFLRVQYVIPLLNLQDLFSYLGHAQQPKNVKYKNWVERKQKKTLKEKLAVTRLDELVTQYRLLCHKI